MAPTSHTIAVLQATERTPLLDNEADTSSSLASISDDDRYASIAETPSSISFPDQDHISSRPLKQFPKIQILLLCYARLMEPVCFFSIFPYIAEMVQRNKNIPVSHVGYYSGLIESVFSATQVIILTFWGSRIGRVSHRKLLICSLIGMAIGPALFGLSTSFWQMVLLRSFTGAFSASNFVIRTMLGELSTTETQATAFSWYGVAGNLGVFLGPIIGGGLVDPVIQYPGAFGAVGFWERHPYALPGFIVGALSATAAISSMLFLKETSTGRTDDKDVEDASKLLLIVPPVSARQLLQDPRVSQVLGLYGYVMVLGVAFPALLPVAMYTPVSLGGMECSPGAITLYMTAIGGSEMLWLMFVFPYLHPRLGSMGILRVCSAAAPLFFAAYPLMNSLLRSEGERRGVLSFVVWWTTGSIGAGTWMSLTAAQLAINEVSPSPEMLGKLNSMADICLSLIKTVVPGVFSAVYAVGVRGQLFSGQVAWWILVLLATGLAFTTRKARVEGRNNPRHLVP